MNKLNRIGLPPINYHVKYSIVLTQNHSTALDKKCNTYSSDLNESVDARFTFDWPSVDLAAHDKGQVDEVVQQ